MTNIKDADTGVNLANMNTAVVLVLTSPVTATAKLIDSVISDSSLTPAIGSCNPTYSLSYTGSYDISSFISIDSSTGVINLESTLETDIDDSPYYIDVVATIDNH